MAAVKADRVVVTPMVRFLLATCQYCDGKVRAFSSSAASLENQRDDLPIPRMIDEIRAEKSW
jgi:hypothetical protein